MMRPLSFNTDAKLVEDGLQRLWSFARRYPWVKEVDEAKARAAVWDAIAAGHGHLVEGYMVLTAVVAPWYTKDRLLQEWLVVKLESGGDLKQLPDALVVLAGQLGCVGVISADSSPIQTVASAYTAAGYSPLTRSFYKVL